MTESSSHENDHQEHHYHRASTKRDKLFAVILVAIVSLRIDGYLLKNLMTAEPSALLQGRVDEHSSYEYECLNGSDDDAMVLPAVPRDGDYKDLLHFWNGSAGADLTENETDALMMAPPRYGPTDRPTNLRLAFLGDSVTRYQAISLIHYLHTGDWIKDDDAPNHLKESTYDTWNSFYGDLMLKYNYNSTSNEKVSSTPSTSRMRCDCFRVENNKKQNNKRKVWAKLFTDNMFYYDECRRDAIYSLAKFGNRPFRGHFAPETIYDDLHYNISHFNETFLWEYHSWADLVRHQLAKLNPPPKYVVVNAGLWPDHDLKDDAILKEMHLALDEHDMVGIYKTTTKRKVEGGNTTMRKHDQQNCKHLPHCLTLNWMGCIAKE